MAEITLRVPLGRPLTYQEVDDNFRSVQELTLLAQQFALSAQEASTLADEAKNEAIAAKDEALIASGSAALDAQRAEDAADRAEAISGFDGLHNTLAGRNEPGAHDASAINYGESSLKTFLDSLYSSVDIRPALRFDFVNQGYLDPRIEFTRASKDWDEYGNEYGIDEPVLTDKGLWTSGSRTNLLLQTKEPWKSPWLVPDSRHFQRIYTSEESPVKGAGIVSFGPSDGEISYLIAIRQQVVTLSPGTYSLSCYMKSLNPNGLLERPSVRSLHIATSGSIGSTGSLVSYISGSGGAATSPSATGSGVFGVSQIVQCEPVGNGWYFYHETFEMLEEAAVRLRLFPYDVVNYFIGDGETGILQTAIQLEEGKIATPYIPTEGSQVTVASTNVNSSGIRETGFGCFLLKANYPIYKSFNTFLGLGSSSTEEVRIQAFSYNRLTTVLRTGGLDLSISSPTDFISPGDTFKAALSFTQTDEGFLFKFFVNGTHLGGQTLPTLPTGFFDRMISIGRRRSNSDALYLEESVSSIAYFNKLLTAEQLQELTS